MCFIQNQKKLIVLLLLFSLLFINTNIVFSKNSWSLWSSFSEVGV